jgi:hypothetical protein
MAPPPREHPPPAALPRARLLPHTQSATAVHRSGPQQGGAWRSLPNHSLEPTPSSVRSCLALAAGRACNLVFDMSSTGVARRYASHSGHWPKSVCMSYTLSL